MATAKQSSARGGTGRQGRGGCALMAMRPFSKKTRCDYCARPATTWKWRTTRLYPSGRTVMANAAACDQHEDCAAFVSMPGTERREDVG